MVDLLDKCYSRPAKFAVVFTDALQKSASMRPSSRSNRRSRRLICRSWPVTRPAARGWCDIAVHCGAEWCTDRPRLLDTEILAIECCTMDGLGLDLEDDFLAGTGGIPANDSAAWLGVFVDGPGRLERVPI